MSHKINVLIDTCSWINLLSETNNKLLSTLEYWIKNNYINIFSHEVIINEWNEHKKKQYERFSQSIKDKYKHANEILGIEGYYLNNIEPNYDYIRKQIEIIDNLINCDTILKTDNDIKVLCSDKTISKEAPYHNKHDSTKDAYIIYSALKYFYERKETFIFISDNKNEFGAPDNLNRKLHPEILKEYPLVNVDYYKEIGQAINELKNILPPPIIDVSYEMKEDNEVNDIYIDTSKSVFEQLYDYLSIRYKELNFIPINILINNHPFNLGRQNSKSHYSLFTLNISNFKLYEMFSSFEISENEILIKNKELFKGISNIEEKIKDMLIKLTNNLIFNVSYSTNINAAMPISFYDESSADNSLIDSFDNFKFKDCFNSLSNIRADNISESLKYAYLQYKIGNYISAGTILKKALNEAVNEGMEITQYLIKYNISKLYILLRFGHFTEDEEIIVQDIKNISESLGQKWIAKNENRSIIDFIINSTAYHNSDFKIKSLVHTIIDHYYSQLHGGVNWNDDVSKLLNEYAALDYYLDFNFIIFNQFYEYKQITKLFIEGLFASHAITSPSNSKLKSLNNWTIYKIITWGDANSINKYYNRYNLKKIKLQDKSFLIGLINNFLDNKDVKNSFENIRDNSNNHFWIYYNNLFNNILVIISICEFEKDDYEPIFDKLLNYLELQEYLSSNSKLNLVRFLNRISEDISIQKFEILLRLVIKDERYRDHYLISSICNIIENKGRIEISEDFFNDFMKIKLKCDKSYPLVHLNNAIKNIDYKQKIKDFIINLLNESFDFELYHQAIIMDVIDFKVNLFDDAFNLVTIDKNIEYYKKAPDSFMGVRHNLLDDFLNICFKFDIDLSSEKYNKLRAINNYYSWLLTPDIFDYSLFIPSWVDKYVTKHYYKRFALNKTIKLALEKALLEDFDPQIENSYINIYVRKTWNN